MFPKAGAYDVTASGVTLGGDSVSNRSLLCVGGAPAMAPFPKALLDR